MILSLRLKYNIKNAAAKDDVSQTLNYGTLCNKIMDVSKDNSGRWALREFAIQLCRSIQLWVKNVDPGREQDRVVSVEILLPKGALRVEGGLGIELSMCGPTETETEFFIVKGLRVPCIIGVHPHEKVEKQTVAIDLKLSGLRDEDFELNGQPIVRAVTAVR